MKTMRRSEGRIGMTPAQTVAVLAALLIAAGIIAYVATRGPAEMPSIEPAAPTPSARPTQAAPAVANVIAAYEAEYDSQEYCFDGEIYELRCEDACGPGGVPVESTAFADCASPKRCCRYAPQEWPSFEEGEHE
jgi:hypothetical protein